MSNESASRKGPSNRQVIVFIAILCFVCGFLLALAASGLSAKQTEAKEFDRSKQMLIAAKILDAKDNFQLLADDGTLTPAVFDSEKKILVASQMPQKAKEEEIKEVAALRIRPLLTDSSGAVYTLEEKSLNLSDYLSTVKKEGMSALPFKLFYSILPNDVKNTESTPESIKNVKDSYSLVFPVAGFGLWGPVYGYIALETDGNTVMGTTWYEHAETPGLGANITEPWWQNQFFHKVIFQEGASGKTDFQTAPIGIIVVKGKVSDVFGTSPKSKSAVDGMSGATLTGDGVTTAYRTSLQLYRPLFIRLQSEKT